MDGVYLPNVQNRSEWEGPPPYCSVPLRSDFVEPPLHRAIRRSFQDDQALRFYRQFFTLPVHDTSKNRIDTENKRKIIQTLLKRGSNIEIIKYDVLEKFLSSEKKIPNKVFLHRSVKKRVKELNSEILQKDTKIYLHEPYISLITDYRNNDLKTILLLPESLGNFKTTEIKQIVDRQNEKNVNIETFRGINHLIDLVSK